MSTSARFAATASLVAALCAPSARASGGDPGFVLTLPPSAPMDSTVAIGMQGPANTLGLFMASFGDGPFPSVYGPICLDFPLIAALPFVLDPTGNASLSVFVPCDTAFIDLFVYTQFITARPNAGLSNPASIQLEDAICVGDLITFNELAWGTDCQRGNEGDAGCVLEDWFDAAFPNGLVVGDQSGDGEDDFFAITFTSPAALKTFLPASDGDPDYLTDDETDPSTSAAGDIVGQLAALKLNVETDEIGALDGLKHRPDLKLGELIIVANVNPDLFGMTVRELIDVSDLAISGELGPGDMDINGDGKPDATLKDLADALRAVNKDFEDGTVHLGTTNLK